MTSFVAPTSFSDTRPPAATFARRCCLRPFLEMSFSPRARVSKRPMEAVEAAAACVARLMSALGALRAAGAPGRLSRR